ncbi:MAG: arginine--tRNA ligase [Candidatus Sungbacteria bacterium]|nr:arginine--tRNA ligase [Candidatus Sungbacteria bacterium]
MKNEISAVITRAIRKQYPDIALPVFSVMVPENPEHGDYATNAALTLARVTRKPPLEVAASLVSAMSQDRFVRVAAVAPGFINFFLTPADLAQTIRIIRRKKERFGRQPAKKETIIIEYSSPNIAKPMGIHHLPTTIIGQTLVNLYAWLGYRVLAMSFPGDWGTQFGSLIAAFKRWGSDARLKKDPISEMLRLYVRFSKKTKEDETFADEARYEFKKLEQGDKKNRKIWKQFRDLSLKDFDRIYAMLGIKIPYVFGESFFEPMLKGIIDEALAKHIARQEPDGAVLIPLGDTVPPLILRKRDGATLYATRDLAQMKYRMQRWHPSKIIIVVANQQTLHFQQVFGASEKLGLASKEQMVHVKFGMVLAPGGKKFATREGNLVRLEDVLSEAIRRAKKIIGKLNPKLPHQDKVATIVGIGAVKFFDLSQNRMSDIVFGWDRMLSLKGSSAPYIQYAYARINGILRKAGPRKSRTNLALLKGEKEIILMRHLLHFPEVVENAALRFEPHHIAEYLVRLAEKINALYETLPVLNAEPALRGARLVLLEASGQVIKNGLALLGIDAPERM